MISSLLEVLIVIALLWVSRHGVRSRVFRATSSILDSSIPARFASTTSGVARRSHHFGVAWLDRSGAHHDVALGIDGQNVYLTPRPAWRAGLGSPTYVIPRGEIVRVTLDEDVEVIEVHGSTIRCEGFLGEVFEETIDHVDVERLIDTDYLSSMMARRQLSSTYDLDRGFSHIRVLSLVLTALVTIYATSHGQRLVALGVVTGGLLIVGVLGRALSHLLKGYRALERVVGCTTSEWSVAAAICVVPPSITGAAIALGVHRSDSLLSFVAGVSFAIALTMATLLVGLAFIKVKSQVRVHPSTSHR